MKITQTLNAKSVIQYKKKKKKKERYVANESR